MKKLAALSLLVASILATGCARPNELGYTPAYTFTERTQKIARNWDYEGKQAMDDMDSALLLDPASHLTLWDIR